MKDVNLFFSLPFLIISFDTIETEENRIGPDIENLNIFLIRKINGITKSNIKYKGLSKVIIRSYISK